MKKKNTTYILVAVLILSIITAVGSYAYWSWASVTPKNIVFNTSGNLSEYIEYDEGESAFLGDLQVSDSYEYGIHSTISIKKTAEVADIDLLATIFMDINAIGNNMKNSPALKWVVTSGTSGSIGSVLSSGNFLGSNAGDTLTLLSGIEVTQEVKQFTIWIWLDRSENPSDALSGETLDTTVWTEVTQPEGIEFVFEVTQINANYQNITATAVNSKNNIVAYTVTTSNTVPTNWTNIASNNQGKIYNMPTYTASGTGTYYAWFKDSEGNTTSGSVTVSSIDTSAPSCSFGSWSATPISNGNTSQIVLTCTDNQSGISASNLTTNSFTKSNNNINITDVTKSAVANGYAYTVTVTAANASGSTTITLPQNSVKNGTNLGNASTTSAYIAIDSSAPTVSDISGGTSLKSTNQTLNLKCSDNIAVTGYYFGTTEPSVANASTTTSASLTALTGTNGLNQTVNAAGTYWLGCKDAAGNFQKKSITLVSYTINNLLETIAGTTGTYRNTNYVSVGSNNYIVKANTSLTLASVYTLPTEAVSATNFKGYSTTYRSTNSTLYNTAPTVSNGTTYYMWFNRNTYSVLVTRPTNGTVSANTVGKTGNTVTATSSSQTLTVKYGDTVKATATAANGYTFSEWSGGYVSGTTNPVTGDTVTATKTITGSFIQSAATVTIRKDGTNCTSCSGYKISLSLSSASDTSTASTTTTNASTTTVSGLSPGTKYYIWIGQDASHTATTVYTGATIDGAQAFTVNYYTITASLSNTSMTINGVSLSHNGTLVVAGTNAQVHDIVATPSAGYSFSSWSSNNANTTIASTTSSTTKLKAGPSTTLTATSTQNKVTITINKNGIPCTDCSGYKISLSTSYSNDVSIDSATTTNSSSVTLGGMVVGESYYIWVGKDSNHKETTVYNGMIFNGAATYSEAINYYTINTSLSNTSMTFNGVELTSNDTILAASTYDRVHNIVATPSAGYLFDSWSSNNVNTTIADTSSTLTSLKAGASTTITATSIPNQSSLKLYKNNQLCTSCGDYAVSLSTQSGSNTANYSTMTSSAASVTFTGVIPGAQYYVWVGKDSKHQNTMVYSGLSVTGSSGNMGNINFYEVTANLTNTAITFNGDSLANNETIVVLGANGQVHNIVATPNTGYTFSKWTTSSSSNSISNTATTAASMKVAAESTLTATSVDNISPTMTVNVANGTTYAKSKAATITISDNAELKPGNYTIRYGWSTSALGCSNLSQNNSVTITVAAGEASKSTTVNITNQTGMGVLYVCNYTAIKDASDNTLNANTLKSSTMYLDNTPPTGTISLEIVSGGVKATISGLNDANSGTQTPYYYKLSTTSTCNSNTTFTIDSSATTYTFNVNAVGTYYACIKVSDKADNIAYLSESILFKVYLNTGSQTDFYKETAYREKIKKVAFVNNITIPGNAVKNYILDDQNSGIIKGWIVNNTTSSGFYDLYIGSESTMYSKNMSNAFYNMTNVESLVFNYFDASEATTADRMFMYTGRNSTNFNLNLGNNFNASNVTSMLFMFQYAGENAANLSLNLGNNFNAIKATEMRAMFQRLGYNSSTFTLNLGNNFGGGSATNMAYMFGGAGANATAFSFNLGGNFDTRNVTNMLDMFRDVGNNATTFSLNLGDHFNTSKVKDMGDMFMAVGSAATTFSLNLGGNFDTRSVNTMEQMFRNMGSNTSNFTFSLGTKFNTSNVINMQNMFLGLGRNAKTTFDFNLGSNFNTINVTNMKGMFQAMGTNASNLNFSLGTQFNTSNVIDMTSMFYWTGLYSGNFILNLGTSFDTKNVTSMAYMFQSAGRTASNFNINLGTKFNMSSVTTTYDMFGFMANSTTTPFTLNLAAGNFANVNNSVNMISYFPTNKATIYVKDATAQQFIINTNSGFSATNVLIRP